MYKKFVSHKQLKVIVLFLILIATTIIFTSLRVYKDTRAASLLKFLKAPKATMSPIVEGMIVRVVEDDFANKKSATKTYIQNNDLRVNEVSNGSLNGFKNGSRVQIEGDVASLVTLPETSSPITVGNQKVAVILANFTNSKETEYTKTELQSKLNTDFIPVVSRSSFGKLNISTDVFGWFEMGIPSTCDFYTFTQKAIAVADSQINYKNYKYLMVVVPALNCSWAGLGTYPPGAGYSTNEGNVVIPTMAYQSFNFMQSIPSLPLHELGHTLGAPHAGGWECDSVTIRENCFLDQTRDFFDIMGYGFYSDFGAYEKRFFGWFSSQNVKEVVSSGEYNVYPIENATTQIQTLNIPIPGTDRHYSVENRTNSGFDPNIPTSAINGALIKIVPAPVGGYTGTYETGILDSTPFYDNPLDNYDAGYPVGSTFTDNENGIKITVVSKNTSSKILKVNVNFFNPPINGSVTDKFDKKIVSPIDDFTTSPCGQNVDSNVIDLGIDPNCSNNQPFSSTLIFRNASLAKNVNVSDSYIELATDGSYNSNITESITITDGITTSAPIIWSISSGWSTGSKIRTPNLNSAIKQVLQSTSWAPGKDLIVKINHISGSGHRRVFTREYGQNSSPRIFIQTGNGPTSSPLPTPTKSPSPSSTSSPTAMPAGVYDKKIQMAADDYSLSSCGKYIYPNEVYFGLEPACGSGKTYKSTLIFKNVNIPMYSKVTNAYIEFTEDGPYSVPLTEGITVSDGVVTPSTIGWPIVTNWEMGNKVITSSLIYPIQEIFNSSSWVSGKNLTVTFNHVSGDTTRRVFAYERDPNLAARLVINTVKPPTPTPVPTKSPTPKPEPTPIPGVCFTFKDLGNVSYPVNTTIDLRSNQMLKLIPTYVNNGSTPNSSSWSIPTSSQAYLKLMNSNGAMVNAISNSPYNSYTQVLGRSKTPVGSYAILNISAVRNGATVCTSTLKFRTY